MAAIGTRLLTFHIHDGDRLVRRESIEAESVTIGASAAAMVRVEDSEMADLQAVLNVNEDGTVQLLDLVGDASTGINGVPTANAELRRGDRITVGNIQITVQIAAPHPAYDDDDTLAEDVMSFVLRNATNPHDASGDRSRGKVLEVAQVFGNAVVDVRHFNGVPVTLGSGKDGNRPSSFPKRSCPMPTSRSSRARAAAGPLESANDGPASWTSATAATASLSCSQAEPPPARARAASSSRSKKTAV